mmetsp:Transcript_87244/g.159891  ORF Transcript_87244/g.159891 Transcript_87244/m.159891 type:complete len:81 (+) Transcript_87244:25-267(+)
MRAFVVYLTPATQNLCPLPSLFNKLCKTKFKSAGPCPRAPGFKPSVCLKTRQLPSSSVPHASAMWTHSTPTKRPSGGPCL